MVNDMKKFSITLLLAFVALAGQAQVKCHIEGLLKDKTQGKTVIVCPASADLRNAQGLPASTFCTKTK